MNKYSTIKIIVNNHAGVLTHIASLFSRRAYNLEGVFVSPSKDSLSSIFLLIETSDKIEQIVSQIEKLYDVKSVSILEKDYHSFFVSEKFD